MKLESHEEKHIGMLRPALAECTVLLRSNGAFPLDKPCRIAAVGNGVRRTVKGGKGSGEVNSRYFVNVEKGLEDAGFSVTTKDWLDSYDNVVTSAHKRFIAQIKSEARAHHMMAVTYGMGMTMPEPEYDLPIDLKADAAIFVLGRDSGEGSDRKPVKGDVMLTDSERRDILKLNGSYEKFMLVINSGAPVDLSGLDEVKNILITVLAATAVIQGNMTLGMMLAVQYIIGQLNSPVEQLVQFIYSWQDVSISLDRMNEIHTETNEENAERTRNAYIDETLEGHSLKIKDLSFKYDMYSPKDILSNINLSIPNDKVTAIVGASGSGKTTLIKLLLGFYEPLSGNIQIGTTNLNEYNLGWWRSQCGAVMQEGYLFSDTIARNIAISDDEPDIERIRHAARVANIADYIEALPLAYNTMIGQDGQGISQGP